MEWSAAAWSVWGKLSPETASSMPLVRHLEDAAAVAGYLWDEFLPHATKRCICEMLGLTDTQGQCLVSWFAAVHDVGKATPAFAAKATVTLPAVLDVMRDQGLDARPAPEDRDTPHATAGQLALERWLALRYPASSVRTRNSYACVVGCHHGTTPADGDLQRAAARPAQLGRGRWEEVRTEILDRMAEVTGASGYLPGWLDARLPLPAQVLISGIVIMADWIASDTDLFPYVGGVSTQERLRTAIERLNLPQPWLPAPTHGDPDALLAARFPALAGRAARPLQARLLEAARQVEQPTLFVVEGPMGVGKTEAALLAAEVLADRFGMGGVFVGLPTMATANPMFDRVEQWAQTALNGRPASITLAHGKAALNEKYADLIRNSWQGQVFDDDADGGLEHATVVVNQWFRGRKRTGLADFVVGTIDQSLFAALKAKHVVLRHLGLAGKVVIIDEVHAADDYMRQYLKRLLGWLGAYRTPVILMSATLPPSQRAEFLNAYSGGHRRFEVSQTDEYPRISLAEAGAPEIAVAVDSRELQVAVRELPDDLAELVAGLRGALAEGGCAAVICNTVGRAQDACAALAAEFGDQVRLVHSRFIAPDRAKREAELVRLLGPDAADRPHRMVVVGTQVLEQSLDVDFDLMVTDLAPVDLLLQRAGRLHRHQRAGRPPLLRSPALWIRGVDDWSATVPMGVRGSQTVYGTQRLLAAAAVLRGVDPIRLPSDIPRLVRVAYDAPEIPHEWLPVWFEAEQKATTERLELVARAQTFLMDDPRKRSHLNGMIDVVSGDPDQREEQGKSQVRDSGEGLEVIALWRGEDGLLRLPEGATRFPGRVISEGVAWGTAQDDQLAREMAACTIRLPGLMCSPGLIERVIGELERQADCSGWQKSRWVAGQLTLVFDASGNSRVADFLLSYDPDLGLRMTRMKEPNQ